MSITKSHRILPVIKNNRYYNQVNDAPESFFFQTIPSFISSLYQRKKRLPENKSDWIIQAIPLRTSMQPIITWIGHASFLIQVAGINILTDPLFGNASAFFPRVLPPGIALKHLPPIDIVLLSHNHPDHCDMASLLALNQLFPTMAVLVPKGDKQWIERRGLNTVVEHMWWTNYKHQSSAVSFTFLPANHWSAHGLFDRNKSLWGSWMIEFGASSGNIYFAGDTAYGDHFKHIAAEFPRIDTALMPIAPGEPHPCMRKSHVDAQQAVQAFIDLNAAHFIPMHWGTFQFGLDTFAGPIERLRLEWALHMLQRQKKLTITKVGECVALDVIQKPYLDSQKEYNLNLPSF